MNKLFTKIGTAMVGIAMAIGVGVAISKNDVKEARADSINHSSTTNLGSSAVSGWSTFSGTQTSYCSRYYSGKKSDVSFKFTFATDKSEFSNISWSRMQSYTLTFTLRAGYNSTAGAITGTLYNSTSAITNPAAVTFASNQWGDSSSSPNASTGASHDFVYSGSARFDSIVFALKAYSYLINFSYTFSYTLAPEETLTNTDLILSGQTTKYFVGDSFSFTGTATATYSDGNNTSTKAVTPTSVSTPNMNTAGEKEITVSYTEGLVTASNTYSINVYDLDHITVSNPKTEFYVGDTFSFGGTATAYFADEPSTTRTITPTFTGYDLSESGSQTVTASYTAGGTTKTTTYTITVKKVQPTEILIGNYTTVYYIGDTFSFDGDMLISFNNGDYDYFEPTSVTSPDMTVKGDHEITVSYTLNGATVSDSYTIKVYSMTGIELSGQKESYFAGEEFVKPTVLARFEDNTTRDITSSVNFTGEYDMDEPDTYTLNASYTLAGVQKSVQYQFTVIQVIPETIILSDYTEEYHKGDEFSFDGKVYIGYNNGDEGYRTPTSVSTPNMNQTGVQTITVGYTSNGVTVSDTYDITVIELKAIEVNGSPKAEFYAGDTFSYGASATATYLGSDKSVNIVESSLSFSGYDMDEPGEQTVTVSYTEAGVTKTTSYEITVTAVALVDIIVDEENSTTEFTIGDEFVKPVVKAKYNNTGSNYVAVDLANITCTGYDMYDVGNQTVTVSYTFAGVKDTAEYEVEIKPVSLAGDFELVTDSSQLADGDKVVIAAKGSNYAISTNQKSNNRDQFAITKTNNKISWTPGAEYTVQEFKLVSGGKVTAPNTSSPEYDSFQFYDEARKGYLKASSSSGNYMVTNSTSSVDTKFVITISTTNSVTTTTIQAKGSSYRNYMRYNSGSGLFSCYANSGDQSELAIYKQATQPASLIKLNASYESGTKKIGQSVSISDFDVTAIYNDGSKKKTSDSTLTGIKFKVGNELVDSVQLESTSNEITLSYGGETAIVVVPAEEVVATLLSVTLLQGNNVKKKGYIDYETATWDLTGLTVKAHWDDESEDTEVSLSSLVQSGDATLSPSKPTVGSTSFTVTYNYLGMDISDATVTLTEAVVADYVTNANLSWTGTSNAQFDVFEGSQLTSEIVNTWVVNATWSGKGLESNVPYGNSGYSLKVGSETISLPYIWQASDNGKSLSVNYGGAVKNKTMKVTRSLNEIANSVTTKVDATLDDLISSLSYTAEGTSSTGGNVAATGSGFTLTATSSYKASDSEIKVYAGGSLSISLDSGLKIKTIQFALGTKTGSFNDETYDVNATSFNITNTAGQQAQVKGIKIVYEKATTTKETYQDKNLVAQKAVLAFVDAFNERLGTTGTGYEGGICKADGSTNIEALNTAWNGETVEEVKSLKTIFLEISAGLSGDDLTAFNNMFKHADSDPNGDVLQRALSLYDHLVENRGLEDFLTSTGRGAVVPTNGAFISPLAVDNDSSTTLSIALASTLVSTLALGGFFFLRKRKEMR